MYLHNSKDIAKHHLLQYLYLLTKAHRHQVFTYFNLTTNSQMRIENRKTLATKLSILYHIIYLQLKGICLCLLLVKQNGSRLLITRRQKYYVQKLHNNCYLQSMNKDDDDDHWGIKKWAIKTRVLQRQLLLLRWKVFNTGQVGM